ncbi:Dabb family protein [Nocardia stercoris]|uniref:Dabb family protein n=1 Tax=Nocardia stercoris TaxID=2483361 RepID=A0A3M2KQU3_9NOCA|nr:Dabb family protein [Nocardia stercoris]RMI27992.1 Dabb family protein [Nocardia stercoris]
MREVIRLLHLPSVPAAEAADLLRPDLRQIASQALRILVEPTLPGTRNGGDVLVRLRFAAPADWSACAARVDAAIAAAGAVHVDGVEYDCGTGGFSEPRQPGAVYRALLLRVAPQTPPDVVAEFEADLLRMPRYISSIRAWRLSPVLRATGSSPWTHVWEQEFTDLDGLNGPYLMHPIHWAHVDRWFDPEFPGAIVGDRICHSFCAAGEFALD